MEYGERLKLARKHAKLTQASLAEESGVKQPSISYLENLENECTGSEFTARFARVCGVSVDWLADELGQMVPLVYQTTDPKIIAVAKIMEPMPEYGKNAAVKVSLKLRNSSLKPPAVETALTAKIIPLQIQLCLDLE